MQGGRRLARLARLDPPDLRARPDVPEAEDAPLGDGRQVPGARLEGERTHVVVPAERAARLPGRRVPQADRRGARGGAARPLLACARDWHSDGTAVRREGDGADEDVFGTLVPDLPPGQLRPGCGVHHGGFPGELRVLPDGDHSGPVGREGDGLAAAEAEVADLAAGRDVPETDVVARGREELAVGAQGEAVSVVDVFLTDRADLAAGGRVEDRHRCAAGAGEQVFAVGRERDGGNLAVAEADGAEAADGPRRQGVAEAVPGRGRGGGRRGAPLPPTGRPAGRRWPGSATAPRPRRRAPRP